MKKIVWMIGLAVLSVAIVACSNSAQSSGDSAEKPPAGEETRLGPPEDQ
ncbi:hypothetical protein QPK87_28455 [Kamptonema cortianum]|nr:hypothetical protein [Geitlerinema splendidum]MDK3160458.1 hypothetical protein [Kamptonema cortianum]